MLKKPNPPKTIRKITVKVKLSDLIDKLLEKKTVLFCPIRSKPALQNADTEWKTACHKPLNIPKSRQKTGAIIAAPIASIKKVPLSINNVSLTQFRPPEEQKLLPASCFVE